MPHADLRLGHGSTEHAEGRPVDAAAPGLARRAKHVIEEHSTRHAHVERIGAARHGERQAMLAQVDRFGRQTVAFFAEKQSNALRGLKALQRFGGGVEHRRDEREVKLVAQAAKNGERIEHFHQWQAKGISHRHAQHAARVRIGAAFSQQHRLGPEHAGGAKDGSHVLWVLNLRANDHCRRAGSWNSVFERSERRAKSAGQRAAVKLIADQLLDERTTGNKDGRFRRRSIGEFGQAALFHQQRLGNHAGRQHPLDDLGAFGDEATRSSAEIRLIQVAEDGQTRIVEIVDRYGWHVAPVDFIAIALRKRYYKPHRSHVATFDRRHELMFAIRFVFALALLAFAAVGDSIASASVLEEAVAKSDVAVKLDSLVADDSADEAKAPLLAQAKAIDKAREFEE